MKIDGLPPGWEIVRIGKPKKGETCIDLTGMLFTWGADCHSNTYPIVRKLPELKPTYRPYKDAAEFTPDRSMWIKSKREDSHGERLKVTVYNDSHVFFNSEIGESYQQLLDGFTFENGEPCGVRSL